MYRATKLGNTWYIVGPYDSLEDTLDDICNLLYDGDFAIVDTDLVRLRETIGEDEEIVMVEPE